MDHGGAIIELFGIRSSRLGCSCEYHRICGFMAVRDAVFRIKIEEIREGMNFFLLVFVLSISSLTSFRRQELFPAKEILTARWITDGTKRCVIGHLPAKFLEHKDNLQGRLAQVVEVLEDSPCSNKRAYSKANQGVCIAVLIDFFREEDKLLSELLSEPESDASVE